MRTPVFVENPFIPESQVPAEASIPVSTKTQLSYYKAEVDPIAPTYHVPTLESAMLGRRFGRPTTGLRDRLGIIIEEGYKGKKNN